MISVMQEYYPERQGNFFVIGASTAFWIGLKIMKPFLSKKTHDRIKFIYKNEELLPFFDQD